MDLLTAPREAVASAFGLGSSLRGERVLHPDGVAFRGTVEVAVPGRWGARLLDEVRSHDVVLRLSRSIGLPKPLPDFSGLAVRFPGEGTHGVDLDLLMASAGSAPVLRHLLVPQSQTLSSLLPFRTSRGWVLLGARPLADPQWELIAARPRGPWQRWGLLTPGEPLQADEGERLRFMPTTGAEDLGHPAWLRSLRERAYRRSQANRP